jgi:CTP:molybdopterin cytidylyltransferase MocA
LSEPQPRLAAVLLAAGAARRYGRAKQLESFEGLSFVRGAALAALDVADDLIVVTGGHAEVVRAELAGLPLRLVHGVDWQLGMGHSIATGFSALLDGAEHPAAALLCLADQPLVRALQLGRLAAAWVAQPDLIIVSDYGAQRGPPCLFPARYFGELMTLSGDSGARSLLKQHADTVTTVAMPEGALDVDTPNDYAQLRQLKD